MNLTALNSSSASSQHGLVASRSVAYDALLDLANPHRAVRFARGRKCGTTGELFNELSAALQFPPYFGENWDACADCLRDLSWFGKDVGLVIVLFDADQVLRAASQAERSSFHGVIGDVMTHWRERAKGVTSSTLHLVLHTEAKDEAALFQAWPHLPRLG